MKLTWLLISIQADDHPSSSDASKYVLETLEILNSVIILASPKILTVNRNELLRAMDLRLAALTGELAAVFDKAVGTKCSFEDITNIEKFSYYFGAVDLR